MLIYIKELQDYIKTQVDDQLSPIVNDYLSKSKGGTVSAGVTFSSTTTVGGAFTANGSAAVKGTSAFTGAATFNGGITTANLTSNGSITGKDGMEIYFGTPFIDFHFGNSSADYTARIIEEASGTLSVKDHIKTGAGTFSGAVSTSGTLSVGGPSTLSGAVAMKNTLNVTGAQTNASTIVATGRISSHDTVGQISDRRLKCDIYGIDRKQAYERALNITGCYYKMKDNLTKRRLGFIAQNVRDYFPEAVFEDENGYYGVSYQELVPVLFQALKYQNDRMNEMEEKLEKLSTPWWKKLFKRNK